MITGGGLHLPMGVATDGNGNVWVSNSTWVVAPCAGAVPPRERPQPAAATSP